MTNIIMFLNGRSLLRVTSSLLYTWTDYILITNWMHWLLFIHKIFSSTCFEPQVLIFRRIHLCTCSIWYCHSLWKFLVACRYTAWVRTDCSGKIFGRGADNSLARPTSWYILFDGENFSFDASLVIHINSNNIPPVMIISRLYENQNVQSL